MNSVQQNVIKHKVGLLNLAAEHGNVSRVCKLMGFFRDYLLSLSVGDGKGGIDALIDANRKKPNPNSSFIDGTPNRSMAAPYGKRLHQFKTNLAANSSSSAAKRVEAHPGVLGIKYAVKLKV